MTNELREALGFLAHANGRDDKDEDAIAEAEKRLRKALASLSASDAPATDRDAVIEECAKVADDGMLVPPDGGSPTEEECEVARRIAGMIRSLRASPAPSAGDGE